MNHFHLKGGKRKKRAIFAKKNKQTVCDIPGGVNLVGTLSLRTPQFKDG